MSRPRRSNLPSPSARSVAPPPRRACTGKAARWARRYSRQVSLRPAEPSPSLVRSALDLDRLTDLEGEAGGAALLGRLAVLDELHDAEGGLGDPHALAGIGRGRGVVTARHLAAVRARGHHPRGLQV